MFLFFESITPRFLMSRAKPDPNRGHSSSGTGGRKEVTHHPRWKSDLEETGSDQRRKRKAAQWGKNPNPQSREQTLTWAERAKPQKSWLGEESALRGLGFDQAAKCLDTPRSRKTKGQKKGASGIHGPQRQQKMVAHRVHCARHQDHALQERGHTEKKTSRPRVLFAIFFFFAINVPCSLLPPGRAKKW
jgi:hypothetical protein